MRRVDPKISRTITWVAGVAGFLVAASLPAGYFLVAYQSHMGALDAEAEINARVASEIINANPEMWRFRKAVLEDFLSRRPRHGYREMRRIWDTENSLIAESVDPLRAPLMSRSFDLKDSGVTVGRIEITRSLWPVLLRTGEVALFGLLIAGVAFVTLRILPLRALDRALSELEEKTKELERSNRELQQFAYVASHDLQEPLRMVSSYMQLLAKRYKGKLDSDAEEFVHFAVDGATRMQGLINALLDYSRVGTRGKEFAPTDCEGVLGSALANLRLAIEESGAEVTHDPLPVVRADGSQLGQLFQNLIGNAIKFRNREAPRVHVSAKPDGNEWIFSVRDNGIGIDPQHAERVFVIFQRLHNREEYPGTGIGLAVCKKIVERHGGRIWVESEIGKGATFHFSLPAQD